MNTHNTAENGVTHFWHPDLLHEVHPGAGVVGVQVTDDLSAVDCDECRSVLIAAVRATSPVAGGGDQS